MPDPISRPYPVPSESHRNDGGTRAMPRPPLETSSAPVEQSSFLPLTSTIYMMHLRPPCLHIEVSTMVNSWSAEPLTMLDLSLVHALRVAVAK